MISFLRELHEVFQKGDNQWNLDSRTPVIEPVLNWGGFVNRSFHVHDDHTHLFVKVSTDPDVIRGLHQWNTISDVLWRTYHGPKCLGLIRLNDSQGEGLVFEWLDAMAHEQLNRDLMAQICHVMQALHRDKALAAVIYNQSSNCQDAYLSTYHDRFTEDLKFIQTDPPPFVSHDLIALMSREVTSLKQMVIDSPAFRQKVLTPVHGDLWHNNILVDSTGRWYILDWDDLAMGDPVMDWAMLFGPTRTRLATDHVKDVLKFVDLNADECTRLDIYARAALLDWVIDPLADWILAAQDPLHGPLIRESNAAIHTLALAAYQALYPAKYY